jgi:hypothetical protein
VEENVAFLNPSIGTYLNDINGERTREIFLNKQALSDVEFEVEGTRIWGHRCLIGVRCHRLREMMESAYIPSTPTTPSSCVVKVNGFRSETFLSVLEYLYCSHTSIHKRNELEILQCASYFGVNRLVALCELYISKDIERLTATEIVSAKVSVVEILHLAKSSSANQLIEFCLHFLCVNNQGYRLRKDWGLMSEEEAEYIDVHQWPPKQYLDELELYEAAIQKKEQSTCVVC